MSSAARAPVADFLADLPLPGLVLNPHGTTVYENPAHHARFASTEVRDALAIALRGGRESAIRAAMKGIARVVPLTLPGGVSFDAHYFPIRDASGAAAFAGVVLIERPCATALPLALPPSAKRSDTATDLERSLYFILDGMPQLVWSTRPDGYDDFYNRRWYEYTGGDPDVTRGAGWNDMVHPDDQQRAWERWRHSVETGEDYEIEYRFRGADGEYRWFLGRALPLRDPDGRIVRWFGTCTDVDDQKRLEQQRAGVLAQAEANNRMKDEFLATVSHELRTPLTAILGWARMQRARPELAPKAIEVIERNAESQAKLLEEILETSRVVTGKIRLHLERVDLCEIAKEAVDTVRPTADAKGVSLALAFDPELPRIVGDPDRLRQVVLNLLVNAVKFTPSGGLVSLRTRAQGSRACVTVSDTGKGISPDFCPHVFERFRQAESSTTRLHGGLGLGLAIVKHLVELHGGTIRASSEGEGKGATFDVSLPIRAVSALRTERARAEPTPSRTPAEPAARLDGIRVLVVDDEPDARELVTMVLREAGAETREADSASSAIQAMDSEVPDVLVSDIAMPLRDGYRLLRDLRSRPPGAGGLVPAVALTAFTRSEDVDRAMDAGFQLHLAKPVEPTRLVAVVRTLARR
jgi:PAS domain S-box-containing protein